MLTDEELKELEAAVAEGTWEAVSDAIRDQIAREHAMRQPLTAEICEKLGRKEFDGIDTRLSKHGTVVVSMVYIAINGKCRWSAIRESTKPTTEDLFAAAKLAGVELDWRKVGV